MWLLVRSLASHCMHLVSGIMPRSVVPPLPKSLQLALLQDHKSDQTILASFADVAQLWVHDSDLECR